MLGSYHQLNEQQQQAVVCKDGPVLIVAGAGTGKTMALTYRITHLIKVHKVDPAQILAVTFTNKAAGEMKERVRNLLQQEQIEASYLPTMGTFHSVCVQILRRNIQHLGYENNFIILDSDDSLALIKRVMKDLGISDKQFNPKAIKGAISAAKNVLQTVDEVQQTAMNTFQQKVGTVYDEYQRRLVRSSCLDFDDLIMKCVELFQKFPQILEKLQYRWRYLHVDEYQDTNMAQYKWVQLLASRFKNICVVGDPDQTIYSWRGADVTNILNFSQEYPQAQVIKLEQNYRSTPFILQGAENLISKNNSRIDKSLWTDVKEGEKIYLRDLDDERNEAEYVLQEIRRRDIQLKECVVLYRTNAQSRIMEEACLRSGTPYKVVGGVKFYARKEIKDILAYLKLVYSDQDDVSVLRVINTPARKIGTKTLETLQNLSQRMQLPLMRVLQHPHALEQFSAAKWKQLLVFSQLIESLKQFSQEFPVSTLITEILHRTGYKMMLMKEKEVGETRLENIQELVSVAQKYDQLEPRVGLATFLEEVTLVSEADTLQTDPLSGELSNNTLTLMTIHNAKGLEFSHVFILGLEEGIFPHSRSAFDPQQLEEERRLMYVAMTRARKSLHLLWARRRLLFGEMQYNPPSSFLQEIPEECLDDEYVSQRWEQKRVSEMRKTQYQQAQNMAVTFSDELPPGMPRFMNQLDPQVVQEYQVQSFEVGDVIEHKAFGRGVIQSLKGDVADIVFDSPRYGVKKLALNVAPVKKINE